MRPPFAQSLTSIIKKARLGLAKLPLRPSLRGTPLGQPVTPPRTLQKQENARPFIYVGERAIRSFALKNCTICLYLSSADYFHHQSQPKPCLLLLKRPSPSLTETPSVRNLRIRISDLSLSFPATRAQGRRMQSCAVARSGPLPIPFRIPTYISTPILTLLSSSQRCSPSRTAPTATRPRSSSRTTTPTSTPLSSTRRKMAPPSRTPSRS